jgi:hypothetical protein
MLFKAISSDRDRQQLQDDLTALEKWEESWQMSFHPEKCPVIRITPHRRKTTIPTTYFLHGHQLEVVEASKYLGVTISNTLTWETHINNTASKANRTVGFLRRNLRECTKPVRDASYKTMVRPILEYAATVWDPYTQSSIQTLENVQRRAARYVCNDYHSRTPGCVTNMLSDLGWESLESRRRQSRLTMMFRIEKNLVDIPLNKYLQRSDARTRGNHRFFQERISDNRYANSFFPRTAKEWNNLPSSVVAAPTQEAFRSLLLE